MAREAEAARMREPVPVANDRPWTRAEPIERGEHGGDLAEGEQAGNIGEGHTADGGGLLDDLQGRRVEHHGGRDDEVPLVVVGHVDPRNEPAARRRPRLVEHDLAAQLVLHGQGGRLAVRPGRRNPRVISMGPTLSPALANPGPLRSACQQAVIDHYEGVGRALPRDLSAPAHRRGPVRPIGRGGRPGAADTVRRDPTRAGEPIGMGRISGDGGTATQARQVRPRGPPGPRPRSGQVRADADA